MLLINKNSHYFECLYFSLYDEDGYGAVKRVLERGEDVETVKPMATLTVNYPVSIFNKQTLIGYIISRKILEAC